MNKSSLDRQTKLSLLAFIFYVIPSSLVCGPGAYAQQPYTPPALPNKDIDDFDVEVKSGRYVRRSPEIISVGDGEKLLSISFSGIDLESSFVHPYGGSISWGDFGSAMPQTIVVNYGGNSETFARGSRFDSSDPIVNFDPQILDGSALRRTYNGSMFQYIFSTKDGIKYLFPANTTPNPSGAVFKTIFPDGYEVTISPNAINDNKGYAIKPIFDPNSAIVSWQAVNLSIDTCDLNSGALCTVSKTRIGQTYNSSEPGSTTSDRNFVTPSGEKTVFRYAAMQVAHYPTGYDNIFLPVAVDLPGGSTDDIKILYNYPTVATRNPDDVMVTQVNKSGLIMSYGYTKDLINTGGFAARGYNLRTVGNVAGIKRYETYSVTPPFSASSSRRTPSTMLTYQDGNLNVTSFQSDRFGRIAGATLPGGSFVSHSFDDRNNYTQTAKGGSGVPNLITQRSFPAACNAMDQPACNLPTSITDPRNAVTNYEYNDRGQPKTVDMPAGDGGATRSRISYFYVMRTAMVKDIGGNIVPAGSPISLLDYTMTCTNAVPCDGQPDQIVTRYDYGPVNGANNLRLRGVSVTARDGDGATRTRLTCYQYNYFGDRIAEIKPRASLSACP